MVVPHEELVTLAAHHPSLELAYLYRIMPAARRALEAHEDARFTELVRCYPPECSSALSGSNRIGVLLCSRRFGELWMGCETSMAHARRYDTNPTELQVATGVLAGWGCLGTRPGIHVVEELGDRAYLDAASEVLGPWQVVHDPDTPVMPLERRRVSERTP